MGRTKIKLGSYRIMIFVAIGLLFLSVSSVHAETAEEHFNRGLAFYNQGNFSQAISEYIKSAEINPNHAETHFNCGKAYSKQGNPTLAIFEYTKAIAINPNFAVAYYNRGCSYYDRGITKSFDESDCTRALSDFTKTIEIDPNYAMAYGNRAMMYYVKGEYDKAWADVHKAEALGLADKPEFIKLLKKASGRDQ